MVRFYWFLPRPGPRCPGPFSLGVGGGLLGEKAVAAELGQPFERGDGVAPEVQPVRIVELDVLALGLVPAQRHVGDQHHPLAPHHVHRELPLAGRGGGLAEPPAVDGHPVKREVAKAVRICVRREAPRRVGVKQTPPEKGGKGGKKKAKRKRYIGRLPVHHRDCCASQVVDQLPASNSGIA